MFLFVLSRWEACLLLAVASSRVPVAELLSGVCPLKSAFAHE